MKNIILLGILFSAHQLCAQNLFLTAAGGTTIYAGDLQPGAFTIHPSNAAAGAGIGYRISPHFLIDANLMYGSIYASDSNFNEPFKIRRNLSFHSKILETNLRVQYDIFATEDAKQFTPYVFAGLGLFHFNPYAYDINGVKTYLQPLGTEGQGLPQYPGRKVYPLTQRNILFGGGIKYNLTDRVSVGLEIDFRKLFTDYLDDVSTKYPDSLTLFNARGAQAISLSYRGDELKPSLPFPSEGDPRGNPSKKDTYRFILFRITYSLQDFGLGNGGSGFSSRSKKQSYCPKKIL